MLGGFTSYCSFFAWPGSLIQHKTQKPYQETSVFRATWQAVLTLEEKTHSMFSPFERWRVSSRPVICDSPRAFSKAECVDTGRRAHFLLMPFDESESPCRKLPDRFVLLRKPPFRKVLSHPSLKFWFPTKRLLIHVPANNEGSTAGIAVWLTAQRVSFVSPPNRKFSSSWTYSGLIFLGDF